ncbi:MAG: ATP-binding protein [Polyangiaceae bacterium]
MRLGIRLQLLLALGALLMLAFVPLFVAVAGLTRATLSGVRETGARALGRAVTAHVLAAHANRPGGELGPLLDAQVGQDGVDAIALYDARGARMEAAGDPEDVHVLPATLPGGGEQSRRVRTPRGAALLVVVSADVGAGRATAAALLRLDEAAPVGPLVRLVALYTGVVGLALLVFAYFVMTRLVVKPVVELSRSAGRVAEGGRALELPRGGARELADLGASIAVMTARLRADEEAMRAKVDELERAGRELRAAQDQLVRSERLASVGRLAAGLAHEIGNPIAAVLGFQELLLDGGLDAAEQRDFLERMMRETERVHRVLRDLLDFARPMARSDAAVEAPGSVSQAIDDVIALVTPQKTMRGVEVRRQVAPGLPAVALAEERLVQVLLNLLLNAADAVPRSGGQVVVRALRGEPGRVEIEVEDNGPGIAPEIEARLFEPFATTKDVGKGTGLGLAVCRGLVEAAGGSIRVLRGGDGGARFVLELPEASEAQVEAF